MGALRQQYQTTDFQIVENILYGLGFVQLSDKQLFIKQLESGEYIKLRHTEMNNIHHLISLIGMNIFSQYTSKDFKNQCAELNNRLLAKYNQISQ